MQRLLLPVVAAIFVVATGRTASQVTTWPGTTWPTATPAAQGLSASAIAKLDRETRDGAYGLTDHLLIVRNGQAVFDQHYPRDYKEISRGKSSPIGCGEGCADASRMHQFNYFHPNWHPYYQGRQVHTLQSVTKSVAATAIGVALGRGEIASVERRVLDFFRDRDLSKVDARLEKATLHDLLTMRSGIEWHENDRPLDSTNTTMQLEQSRDWIGFTLSQPMDAEPGTKWVYNSGGSALLAGIIRSASKAPLDEYAREHLFRPIGITEFHWKRTEGLPDSEGGLYLQAADLARIGYLYLHDGVWNGRRILPAGWVKSATTRHVTGVAPGWDYGYQWWLASRDGADIWAGRGFGGQLLIVIPSRGIVAVVNAWNVFGTPARGVFTPLIDALFAPADR